VVHRPSRLRALATLEANAESAAQALDRIAGVACRALHTPVALVNLIGAGQQRFVGCAGPPEWKATREMPVTYGFCPFALGAEHAYAFADAGEDPELASNPAVVELGVTAYAGVPLRAPDGEPVGTLCTIDTKRHEWSDDDLAILGDLAASAVSELQLLAATLRAARQEARFHALTSLSRELASARSAGDVVDVLVGEIDQIGASAMWLLVLGESGETVRAAAAAGADPEVFARHSRISLDAQRALAQLASAGEPEVLPTRADVEGRCAPLLEVVPNAGSVAWLPITAAGERIGVLGVCFSDERVLSDDDREYLAALCGVSSLALAHVA
jgi:GAF domain-containing protein